MRKSWFAVIGAMGLAMAGAAQAAPLTLSTGSTVTASVFAFPGGQQDKVDAITSLPVVDQNTVAPASANTSSVLSNLSTSGFKFDFTQSVPEFGRASGRGDIFFTAGEGVTFTISGFQTTHGAEYTQSLVASLTDLSTKAKLYDFHYDKNVGFSGEEGVTLTLDATGGSLTGSLIAGHLYEFIANESIETFDDPAGNGTVQITFAQATQPGGPSVPLPPAAALGILGAAFAGAARKRMTTK